MVHNASGSVQCLKYGKIAIIIMEIAPTSAIENNLLLVSGLFEPLCTTYLSVSDITGKTIPCVIDETCNLLVYFPSGQFECGRIDATVMYITT